MTSSETLEYTRCSKISEILT